MFTRELKKIETSAFLLGPRGTGKSTWIQENYAKHAVVYDLLNEIRAYLHYTGRDYPVYFWRSQNGVEVDIVLETSRGYVAIELKNSSRWEKVFNRGLHRLSEEFDKSKVSLFGVFRGARQLLINTVLVYPALEFLRRLWGGEIIKE